MAKNPDPKGKGSFRSPFLTLWCLIAMIALTIPPVNGQIQPQVTGSTYSAAGSSAQSLNVPPRNVYRFGMVPWIAYSPLHVAEKLGFWQKLGVEVKVVSFTTNPAMYRGIASGEVDLCMDMIGSMIGMHLDGIDVKILGETDWSHGGDKIIVKRNLDVARLKAHPIGVYLGKPSVTVFLDRFLKKWGLSLADVRVQEMTMQELTDAFIEDKFNVIINCDPEALRAERDGEGHLAATSAGFDGVVPEGFVARADRFARIPHEDLVKIFRGWIQAVRWIQDPKNWADFRKILNTRTFAADGPCVETDLLDMYRSVRIHPASTQERRNISPTGLREYLKEVHRFLKDNRLLGRDFSVSEILDNGALLEALRMERGTPTR